MERDIRTIGVVGTGVIGASWAAYFLSRGFHVRATDPAPGAEARLQSLVRDFLAVLHQTGAGDPDAQQRLVFDADLGRALAGVDFVQENGPERLGLKRELLAAITAAIAPDVIVATSSSGILISEVQAAATGPERIVLGHPFNPPHLIPLVEVLGGQLTSPAAVERAMAFYASIGKKPIHLHKEVKGHVANRLQAALWREALSLVENGVASVQDVDLAISHGPGLRWALLGPFTNMHLSGGAGGLAHFFEHIGPPIESWWKDMSVADTISPEARRLAVQGMAESLAGADNQAIEQARDTVLVQLLAAKAAVPRLA